LNAATKQPARKAAIPQPYQWSRQSFSGAPPQVAQPTNSPNVNASATKIQYCVKR
jgi:hypothetical protein